MMGKNVCKHPGRSWVEIAGTRNITFFGEQIENFSLISCNRSQGSDETERKWITPRC